MRYTLFLWLAIVNFFQVNRELYCYCAHHCKIIQIKTAAWITLDWCQLLANNKWTGKSITYLCCDCTLDQGSLCFPFEINDHTHLHALKKHVMETEIDINSHVHGCCVFAKSLTCGGQRGSWPSTPKSLQISKTWKTYLHKSTAFMTIQPWLSCYLNMLCLQTFNSHNLRLCLYRYPSY